MRNFFEFMKNQENIHEYVFTKNKDEVLRQIQKMSQLPFEKQVLNMLFAKINHNFEDISKYENYIQQLSFDDLRAFSSSLYSNLNLDLMFVGNLLPKTALVLSQKIVSTL